MIDKRVAHVSGEVVSNAADALYGYVTPTEDRRVRPSDGVGEAHDLLGRRHRISELQTALEAAPCEVPRGTSPEALTPSYV